MSTYWTYKCNDCNLKCETSGNRQDKALLNILKLSKEFKTIRETDSESLVEISVLCFDDSYMLIDFIIEHYGHNIVVQSEYGDYITKDGVYHDGKEEKSAV